MSVAILIRLHLHQLAAMSAHVIFVIVRVMIVQQVKMVEETNAVSVIFVEKVKVKMRLFEMDVVRANEVMEVTW